MSPGMWRPWLLLGPAAPFGIPATDCASRCGDGIGVTLIAPGRVATPFWDTNGGPPAGGLLTADQIADAIVWAISQPSGVDVNTVIVRPIGQPG
jgi:NADP-dependent 3-hydroxy acid dehydrogenase YdfG